MKGGSSALADLPASCKMAGILVFCVSLLMLEAVPVGAFSASLFQEVPTAQQIFPSKTDGVDIELPNFDELFGRIQQVSPLARVAVESNRQNGDSDAPPGAQGRGLVATTDHQSGECATFLPTACCSSPPHAIAFPSTRLPPSPAAIWEIQRMP